MSWGSRIEQGEDTVKKALTTAKQTWSPKRRAEVRFSVEPPYSGTFAVGGPCPYRAAKQVEK